MIIQNLIDVLAKNERIRIIDNESNVVFNGRANDVTDEIKNMEIYFIDPRYNDRVLRVILD